MNDLSKLLLTIPIGLMVGLLVQFIKFLINKVYEGPFGKVKRIADTRAAIGESYAGLVEASYKKALRKFVTKQLWSNSPRSNRIYRGAVQVGSTTFAVSVFLLPIAAILEKDPFDFITLGSIWLITFTALAWISFSRAEGKIELLKLARENLSEQQRIDLGFVERLHPVIDKPIIKLPKWFLGIEAIVSAAFLILWLTGVLQINSYRGYLTFFFMITIFPYFLNKPIYFIINLNKKGMGKEYLGTSDFRYWQPSVIFGSLASIALGPVLLVLS